MPLKLLWIISSKNAPSTFRFRFSAETWLDQMIQTFRRNIIPTCKPHNREAHWNLLSHIKFELENGTLTKKYTCAHTHRIAFIVRAHIQKKSKRRKYNIKLNDYRNDPMNEFIARLFLSHSFRIALEQVFIRCSHSAPIEYWLYAINSTKIESITKDEQGNQKNH